MSEKKTLDNEQLDQASGGFFQIGHKAGYWYRVTGDGTPYRYLDEKYGYATSGERDTAMEESVAAAQKMGVINISTSSGYIKD